MQSNKYCLLLMTMVAMLLHVEVMAQSNTMNTFSTYSMYGLGELQSQGTLTTRSLGGAGVAMRSVSSINLLNPASYSIAIRKGILMDFGFEGKSSFSAQEINGDVQKGAHTSANFNNIALQMPIAKGIGFGFSVNPYSTVGYRNLSNSIEPELGYIANDNNGSGTITEVKLGVGWEIMSGLSIGAAAQYYWGDIDRIFMSTITNMTATGTSISVVGVDNISVSKIKGQVGLQAELANNDKRVVTMGATLDIGGDLGPRYVRAVTGLEKSGVYAQGDTTTVSVVLPRSLTIGAEYSDSKYQIMADVSYQGWGNNNDFVEMTNMGMDVAYCNTLLLRAGVQYTPRRSDVRHYMKRVSYRFGGRYGGYQYTFGGENIMQYAATFGMGLPLKVIGVSRVDVGLEWGGLGSLKEVQTKAGPVGLVRQNYLKFSLGFTLFGDDYWFMRPQID